MTQNLKAEVSEEIQVYVLMGFDNKEEIFDSITDMFYTEELDEDWLKTVIDSKYDKHQLESLQWEKPTDFDRLVSSFDSLINQKIVCLHVSGPTRQDGIYNCEELIKELRKNGFEPMGYCFYHMQDLERAVEPESRNLYLGFDSAVQDDDEALVVGNMICKALSQNGLAYLWNNTVDERILIENLNWQKVPDDEDYGEKRVLKILLNS